MKNKEKKER